MFSFQPFRGLTSADEEIYVQQEASYLPDSAIWEGLLAWVPFFIVLFTIGMSLFGWWGGIALFVLGQGLLLSRMATWRGEVVLTDRQLIIRHNPVWSHTTRLPLSQIRVISTKPITDPGEQAQWIEVILQNGEHQRVGPLTEPSTLIYHLGELSGARLEGS